MERIKMFGKSIEELAALQAKVAELSRKEDIMVSVMESVMIVVMAGSLITLLFFI
jgi:hypothetical protein